MLYLTYFIVLFSIFDGIACLKQLNLNSLLLLRQKSTSTKLNTMSVNEINKYIPFLLEPTSKTTTLNDPTAGMSPDEITNYMSNVGGGLCGFPEIVRNIVGLGLNLSLLTFAILTLGYSKI